MTTVQMEYKTQISGALQQVQGSDSQRITVTTSSVPELVPAGADCELASVHFSKLRFNDLVVSGEPGSYRVRRVLRTNGEGVFLEGTPLKADFSLERLRLLKRAWHCGRLLNRSSRGFGHYLAWVSSFFVSPRR